MQDRKRRFSFIQKLSKMESCNRFWADFPLIVCCDQYRSPSSACSKRERSPCSREFQPSASSGSATGPRSFTPDRDKDSSEPPPQKICEYRTFTILHKLTWMSVDANLYLSSSQVSASVPVLTKLKWLKNEPFQVKHLFSEVRQTWNALRC